MTRDTQLKNLIGLFPRSKVYRRSARINEFRVLRAPVRLDVSVLRRIQEAIGYDYATVTVFEAGGVLVWDIQGG